MQGDASAIGVELGEHDPVITLGRHAEPSHVVVGESERARLGIEMYEVERGGDVTYHGPGQLMVYPVWKVGVRVRDFLKCIAEALSEVAAGYGASGAHFQSDPGGLWLEGRKLAACGLHVSRGICIHGFAFNVRTPPAAWNAIVPCGLTGPAPLSLLEILGEQHCPSVEEFAQRLTPVLQHALVGFGTGGCSSFE